MPNHYESLAELDYHMLRFQRLSDEAARNAGLQPLAAKLMLALKGLPEGWPTIREIAERLQVQHHSAVETVKCLVAKGLLARHRGKWDQRIVLLRVTPAGEAVLRTLVQWNLRELRNGLGASLVKTISRTNGPMGRNKSGKASPSTEISRREFGDSRQ